MKFTHEVSLPANAEAVDLSEWLFGLSEADYARCAHGHRAVGVLGGAARSGMVNVESIGGSLLIQHYATRVAERHRVTMVSDASRAYLMHLVPVTIAVKWDMEVKASTRDTSSFRCSIDVAMPLLVRILGLFNGTGFFVKRHLLEETAGFARDIARKYAARPAHAAA